MTDEVVVSEFEVASAAKSAIDASAAGAGVPPSIVAAIEGAGFGPHDRWPNVVISRSLESVGQAMLQPDDVADWAATSGVIFGRCFGDERDDVVTWLLQVGDPAWPAVDAAPADGGVEAQLRAARDALAVDLAAAAYTCAVDAARALRAHRAETKTGYAQEDAAMQARWDEDDVDEATRAVQQAHVAKRRDRAALLAMWGVKAPDVTPG